MYDAYCQQGTELARHMERGARTEAQAHTELDRAVQAPGDCSTEG